MEGSLSCSPQRKRNEQVPRGTRTWLASALFVGLAFIPFSTFASPPTARTSPVPLSSQKNRTLWDQWYGVTLNRTYRAMVYRSVAEIKDGKLYIRNQATKKEEGFLNEEQLGELSEWSPKLYPILYNLRSTYRTTETIVDGSEKNGFLQMKVRKGQTELPALRKAVPKRAILSESFPAWLAWNGSQLKPGEITSLYVFLEDQFDSNASALPCQVRRMTLDSLRDAGDIEFEDTVDVLKFKINLNGQENIWWVDSQGKPLKIYMKSRQTWVKPLSPKEAEVFLSEHASGN
jgi:hypothetical protein